MPREEILLRIAYLDHSTNEEMLRMTTQQELSITTRDRLVMMLGPIHWMTSDHT